ncbi:MAG: small multi-drug export protein [Planctomycetes bacterium]|nr:small multi-drug export protein [Planctomycetota bacterium]
MPIDAREQRTFVWTAITVLIAFATFMAIETALKGSGGLGTLGVMAVSFQVAGKFLIFSGLHPDVPFRPFEIATFSLLFDLLIAVVLATGIERLTRLPVVGPMLANARAKSHEILIRYPGLKRTAFWGVALFVFLPLPASGAISGTFATALLGLPRMQGILAIGLGSAGVCYLFATLAIVLGEEGKAMLQNPWLLAAGVAVFVVFLWWAYKHCKKILERA